MSLNCNGVPISATPAPAIAFITRFIVYSAASFFVANILSYYIINALQCELFSGYASAKRMQRHSLGRFLTQAKKRSFQREKAASQSNFYNP